MSIVVGRKNYRKAADLRRAKRQELNGLTSKNFIVYDRAEIKKLLLTGLSMKKVADIVGCSSGPVGVVRKELINQGVLLSDTRTKITKT